MIVTPLMVVLAVIALVMFTVGVGCLERWRRLREAERRRERGII